MAKGKTVPAIFKTASKIFAEDFQGVFYQFPITLGHQVGKGKVDEHRRHFPMCVSLLSGTGVVELYPDFRHRAIERDLFLHDRLGRSLRILSLVASARVPTFGFVY